MNRNMLSVRDYIIETLLWAIAAFVWYQNLFFTNIEGKTVRRSNVILVGIIAVIIAVNIILTVSWNRTSCSVVASVLIPYGVYAYITYAKYTPGVCRIILWAAVGICALALLCIFAVRLHTGSRRKRVIRKARMACSALRFTGAAASTTLIICLFCNGYVDAALFSPDEKPSSSYGEEYTVAANMDTVLLLQEEEWLDLSLEKRMDVLQCICNIEGNYLGLNREVHIDASKLEENLLGFYKDSDSSIQISTDLVESGNPYETLNAVCHEMYHAGQARYIEIFESLDEDAQRSYFLYDASVYANEFRNYKRARTADDVSDYLEYYWQRCEQDARGYAQKAVTDYYNRILEYLEQNGNTSDKLVSYNQIYRRRTTVKGGPFICHIAEKRKP